MIDTVQKKINHLQEILTSMNSVLVAYSGGVDSTFLLAVASNIPGIRVEAATAVSPTYTSVELKRAKEFTASRNIPHHIVHTDELSDPCFRQNPPERCYYCKKYLFMELRTIATSQQLSYIVDGTNADDFFDYRPGRKAAQEAGIRSPLAEAKFTKSEIREASRRLGLTFWNMPAQACLASRIPYGTEITEIQLQRVYEAEQVIKNLGFEIVRVRDHGNIARIEVSSDRLLELVNPEIRKQISTELRKFGYTYVTIDLDGYRTGSMNETLSRDKI